MEKIFGIDVYEHEKSKRILNIRLNDEIIEKIIFPFNKFDLTALELKPFTRFTIAKSLEYPIMILWQENITQGFM